MEDKILNSGVTLVDFWAPWCGPCKSMHFVLNKLEQDITDNNFKIIKINIDEPEDQYQMDLMSKLDIRAIPFFVIFKNGEIFKTMTGVQPYNNILSEVKRAIQGENNES